MSELQPIDKIPNQQSSTFREDLGFLGEIARESINFLQPGKNEPFDITLIRGTAGVVLAVLTPFYGAEMAFEHLSRQVQYLSRKFRN